MAQPLIGEIRQFGGTFAPAGWALCQGQLLAISDYDTLFNLIGTTYGGDGQNTFGIPDLRGRVPIHQGTNVYGTYTIGETGGTETVTLSVNQIPAHTHAPLASATTSGGSDLPTNNTWGASTTGKPYGTGTAPTAMNALNIPSAGGSQPHDNMIPYLTVNYIISLFGIYPTQGGGSSSNQPFLAQVNIFSFNFAPSGYATCNGQLLPINQNQALFSLLGTTYGGNGQTTFALPNLQGRVQMHVGNGLTLGQLGGEVNHTLTAQEMPSHTHTPNASTTSPNSPTPLAHTWASNTGFAPYAGAGGSLSPMSSLSLATVGGGQTHNNMPPYLVLTMCIALTGIFPSRN